MTTNNTAALYLHVPFCRSKCRYCDFYSLPLDAAQAQRYVRATARRLADMSDQLRLPLESIFIGGGTPGAIGANLLAQLLAPFTEMIDERTEFSVELNPGSVGGSLATALTAAGVNRVNLGVQSFHEAELALLGRAHTAKQAEEAFDALAAGGLANVGLDLIYGLPRQTLRGWQGSLDRALALQPSHLSCYGLTFEPGTPLYDDLLAGRVQSADDERQRGCYDMAIDAVTQAGMEHYEISNFARPGRRCRHNITYWRNRPYLGIGPAAASFIDGQRRTNHRNLQAWLAASEAGGDPPHDAEHLAEPMAMAEALMLGLRLIDGIGRHEFAGRYGSDPVEAFPETIARYADQGALVVTPGRLRLSRDALFVADTVLADILAEAMRQAG
ncbi:MAG: radical SAM family heme chaperone HemW [Planctomycetota bacterium]|jgi:oxygen-independent coproporphyrinogen-3 oxidase